MADIRREYREHCHCRHGCPTYADIREWSCGCVEVDIHRDRTPGRDCTDFSGRRRRCGKPGRPGE